MRDTMAGGEPDPKRQRREFPVGSIMKIEVINFMTYAKAVIEPGAKLNLVLGPNGTGKSSLVCAICLGLAGPTRLLGRGEEMSSFVRRGTDVGEVTLTLASTNPQRPHVVRRRIKASDNSSEWWINGASVRQKDVLELAQRLNIQLDNLCQFLPQEKVASFAQMTPVQLLWATERAVGNAALVQQHELLVQRSREKTELDASVVQVADALGKLKEENVRAERSVAVIQQRDALMAEAKQLQQKVPWAQYDAVKAGYEQEKDLLTDAKRELRRLRAEHDANDAPLRAKQQALDAARSRCQAAQQAVRRSDPAAKNAQGKDHADVVDDLLDQIQALSEEVEGLEQKAADREHRLQALAREVETAAAAVAAAPTGIDPEIQTRLAQVRALQRDITQQELALEAQVEEARVEGDNARQGAGQLTVRLARLSDAKRMRLQVLEQRHRGITEAYSWLSRPANKALFQGKVLGPIAVEVEVHDPTHAAMLEQHVSNNLWAYFVVEHERDQDLLTTCLREQCSGFRPMVAYYHGDSAAPLPHPVGRGTDFARFGAIATLDECFQAPGLVKHVLNDNARISSAFVLGDANANWEGLFAAAPRASVAFTPQSNISRRTSAYNAQAVSTSVRELTRARIFAANAGAGSSAEERAQLEAQLAGRREEEERAHAMVAALQPQLAEAKDRKRRTVEEINELNRRASEGARKRTSLQAQQRAKQLQLQRLQQEACPLRRRHALEQQLATLREAAFNAALALARSFVRAAPALMEFTAADLSLKELTDQTARLAGGNAERERRVHEKQADVEHRSRQVASLLAHAKARQEAAKAATGWPLPKDLQEAFAALPAAPDELVRMARAKEDEAEGLMITDPGALQRYRQRCEQIATAEGELAELQVRRDLAAQEIADAKALWLPELRRIVTAVNATFEAAFPTVGSAGEVALVEAPGDDFKNFAVHIRVKFRHSEPLATLDANRQSGGERSVSTILFLVALQGIAVAPFRVVDEINQGMDAANERKAFKLLADAATAPDTPQCFLLTPKLLPDLPFAAEIRVMQIMNGTKIKGVAAGFSMDRLLGQRTAGMMLPVAA